ncbi:hypothetical protein HDU80_010755 [Chytriomyces hyalinus]|nr:hypothetical protein HDU80_010755 [Chytriomyces hyalinus]
MSSIVHISEIHSHISHMAGDSVRVLGRIVETDPKSTLVTIAFAQSPALLVDTRLIGALPRHSSKTLFQFVGDIEQCDDLPAAGLRSSVALPVFLNARIARVMDGLDVALFDKALTARRVFESQRGHLAF